MVKNVLQQFDILQFQQDLLEWYKQNKRDLPWRKDRDPYKIWVSEIMLQQTKVDTVIPYFNRFIEKYPTVFALANAEEEEVLKMWEGLGYYSRARNLQSAAKEVVANHNGVIPDNPKELGALKGIGPYTKGAILSIAFDKPEPAVDGNVLRVISRILKMEADIAKTETKKDVENIIRAILSRESPSSFNQAMMELGALICTPKSPMCMLCPVMAHCQGFAAGMEQVLPIKTKAKKQKRISYLALLIQNEQGKIVIEKRPGKGLLANLWQFPMVPVTEIGMAHAENWMLGEYGLNMTLSAKKGKIKHVFSHLIWDLDVMAAKTSDAESADKRLRFVEKEELAGYPFPVPHQKMIDLLNKG